VLTATGSSTTNAMACTNLTFDGTTLEVNQKLTVGLYIQIQEHHHQLLVVVAIPHQEHYHSLVVVEIISQVVIPQQ